MEVLAIDDDNKILKVIQETLREEGFTCHITNSCEEGLELLKIFPISLVLLDLDLGVTNMNGLIFLKTLRKARSGTIIFVLSGISQTQEKIKALDMGADDYLVKPCDKKELIARMKRHLLRSSNYYCQKLIVGELEMDIERKIVSLQKKSAAPTGRNYEYTLKLTKKEYDLLYLLMSKPNFAIEKVNILKHLYRDKCEEPDIKIIDVLICKIRKEVAKYTNKEYIETKWARGYLIKDPSPNFSTKSDGAGAGATNNYQRGAGAGATNNYQRGAGAGAGAINNYQRKEFFIGREVNKEDPALSDDYEEGEFYQRAAFFSNGDLEEDPLTNQGQKTNKFLKNYNKKDFSISRDLTEEEVELLGGEKKIGYGSASIIRDYKNSFYEEKEEKQKEKTEKYTTAYRKTLFAS